MIPLVLFQIVAQGLLFWVFYWAATAPSPTQGYVFYRDYLTSFMVEVLVGYGIVLAAGAASLGFVECLLRARWVIARDTLAVKLRYLSYAAHCLFSGGAVGLVLVIYLLLASLFGEDCFPISGGTCDYPKSFLPYMLFYAVSSVGLLVEGIVAC